MTPDWLIFVSLAGLPELLLAFGCGSLLVLLSLLDEASVTVILDSGLCIEM